jgi:hypothetical protein
MNNRRLSTLGLSVVLLMSQTTVLFAQPSTPVPGQNRNPPERTAGAGSRGCPGDPNAEQTSLPLTAITPENNIIYTERDRANVYVYIPPEHQGRQAYFQLVDLNSEELIFRSEPFEVTTTGAIARLVLPENVQLDALPLQDEILGYNWGLYIICPQASANAPRFEIHTQGWIYPLNAADVTSSTRLWHEQIETWLTERDANPTAWEQGLAVEALDDFVALPVETYRLQPEVAE